MVVACRTQWLFSSRNSAKIARTLQLTTNIPAISFSRFFHGNSLHVGCNKNLRLCQCRFYHPSQEGRSPLTKLTPQEVLSANAVLGFYYPNCEFAGMSCLDCYTQKQCLDFWGLVHWSSTSCGTSVSGYANVYCNPSTNKCSALRPEGCDPLSKYTCLRNGLLPDINDCKLYHHCKNMTAEDFTCGDNYVYKHEYGKCVFKLSSADCFTIPGCSLEDYKALYPGDSSIYYGCTASTLSLNMCKESETYSIANSTCMSRCTANAKLPNPRNCSEYYSCGGAGVAAVTEVCPAGTGYNPYRKTCEWQYANLCNELTLYQDDFYDLISINPIAAIFVEPLKWVLNFFNLSPDNVLFMFGLDDQMISNVILIGDYVYKNQNIPPTTIGIIIDMVIQYLPPEIRTIIQTLMNLGIINVRSAAGAAGSDAAIREYLEASLTNARIDVHAIIRGVYGKNATQVSSMVFQEILGVFNVPPSQMPFLAVLVKNNMPLVANSLNQHVGMPLFVANGDLLKLNPSSIDGMVYNFLNDVAVRLYPDNLFFAEFFKMSARQQYLMNHGEVDKIVDTFYFSAANLLQ